MLAVAVYVADKLFQSVDRVEYLFFGVTFLVFAKVCKLDIQSCVKIRELAHAVCQRFVFVFCGNKDRVIRPELLASTAQRCFAYYLYRIQRFSFFIFLLINFPIAEYL